MAGAVDDRATRRSNGSVRIRLPESTPATTTPTSRGRVVDDGGTYGAGGRARSAIAEVARGVVPRSVASALGALPVIGPMIAAASPLVTTQPGRVAARNFIDGLTGTPKGGTRVPVQPAAPQVTRDPVAASLMAGRTAPATPITPHERMLSQLDTILGSNRATMSDLQAVSGMLPDPGNVPDAKDTVLGTTAQVSQSVYADAIADISARRAAGTLTQDEAKAATAKATDAYFLRNTALVANPLSYAQANMLPTDEELEQ
jgi:hypothetical protein